MSHHRVLLGWDLRRVVLGGTQRGKPAGYVSWASTPCTGFHTQKGPGLGLMLCCHHLEILNSFEGRCPIFSLHWALQLLIGAGSQRGDRKPGPTCLCWQVRALCAVLSAASLLSWTSDCISATVIAGPMCVLAVFLSPSSVPGEEKPLLMVL